MQHYLEGIKSIKEDTKTLISICVYNLPINDVQIYFEHQLSKLKTMTHLKSKNILSERISRWLDTIRHQTGVLCSLFFLGNEIYKYPLTSHDNKTIQEFNLHNPYFKSDFVFHVKFFIDFFCNRDFYLIFNHDKKSMIHLYSFSKDKKIIKNQHDDLDQILETCKKDYNILDIYAVGTKHSKYKHLPELLTKLEFFDYLKRQEAMENMKALERQLSQLSITPDLFVFGRLKREILEAIQSFQLKELYIDAQKLEKIQSICDASYFNFKVFPIVSLVANDTADQFLKNHNGLMGVKYF